MTREDKERLSMNLSFLQLKAKQAKWLSCFRVAHYLPLAVLRDGLTEEGGYKIHRLSPPVV